MGEGCVRLTWSEGSSHRFTEPSLLCLMEEPTSPSEQDIIVSRLVARIAELEEKLYSRELGSLATPGDPSCRCRGSSNVMRLTCLTLHAVSATSHGPARDVKAAAAATPRLPGLLSAIKGAWAQPHLQERPASATPASASRSDRASAPRSDWLFSMRPTEEAAPPAAQDQAAASPSHAATEDDAAVGSLPATPASSEEEGPTGVPAASEPSAAAQADPGGSDGGSSHLLPPPPLPPSPPPPGENDVSSHLPPPTPLPPPPGEKDKDDGPESGQPRDNAALALEAGLEVEEESMPVVPAPTLTTRLIFGQPAPPHPSPVAAMGASASDWLSGFFAPRRQQLQQQQQGRSLGGTPPLSPLRYEAFNEKSFQARMEEQGRVMEAVAAHGDEAGSYYRYVSWRGRMGRTNSNGQVSECIQGYVLIQKMYCILLCKKLHLVPSYAAVPSPPGTSLTPVNVSWEQLLLLLSAPVVLSPPGTCLTPSTCRPRWR